MSLTPMDEDRLSWTEFVVVEDTERCEACHAYFVPDELIEGGGVRLCIDCIDSELAAAELSGPELLRLEDKRDVG